MDARSLMGSTVGSMDMSTSTQMTNKTSGSNLSSGSTASGRSRLTKQSSCPDFVGMVQKHIPKESKKQPVEYERGGSDFRTVLTSSIGKQTISKTRSYTGNSFGNNGRFSQERSRSPGPAYGPVGDQTRQVVSRYRTPGKVHFGTSTRDDSLKLYGLWSVKKWHKYQVGRLIHDRYGRPNTICHHQLQVLIRLRMYENLFAGFKQTQCCCDCLVASEPVCCLYVFSCMCVCVCFGPFTSTPNHWPRWCLLEKSYWPLFTV